MQDAFNKPRNIDLQGVNGLDAVKHIGPSHLGIDTIYRSKGNIPEAFLRGAGVPEPFIVQIKSLVGAMSPIEFYSCFISYSHADKAFARKLHDTLQSKGIRCSKCVWWPIFDKQANSTQHSAKPKSLNPTPIVSHSLKCTPIWDDLE